MLSQKTDVHFQTEMLARQMRVRHLARDKLR